MFTWLAQSSTMQSLRFALANIIFNPPKSRNWKPVVYISNTLTTNGKYDIGWNRSYAPQDYIAFTFDHIINIVSLDFAHSHFIIGDAVFVQKDGCPIGGYLSSPLAQMKCMCDEDVLIRTLLTPSSSKHFYGIRQVFHISMDSTNERKDNGGKGERQEKRGRKDGGKVDQAKKCYWKEAYLEEEDFSESELWNEDEIRMGRNIYIQVEDTWKLYKACRERIKALEQGDERQRKIEELEEEAGTNKQIYETLWGLARQRRRRYLKTRYDQASRVLESLAFNPDEEEDVEERCKNKRQRTTQPNPYPSPPPPHTGMIPV
eukprot:g61398.t1